MDRSSLFHAGEMNEATYNPSLGVSGIFMFYILRCKNNILNIHCTFFNSKLVFVFLSGHSSSNSSSSAQVVLGTGSCWFATFPAAIWEIYGRSGKELFPHFKNISALNTHSLIS